MTCALPVLAPADDLPLALGICLTTQQAVIDEYAGQLVTDGLVRQCSDDGGMPEGCS